MSDEHRAESESSRSQSDKCEYDAGEERDEAASPSCEAKHLARRGVTGSHEGRLSHGYDGALRRLPC